LKLYRALEGKFVLLQDELENENDASSTSDTENAFPGTSDDTSEENESKFLETHEILANKRACAYFERHLLARYAAQSNGFLEYCRRDVDARVRDAMVLYYSIR
jgi:hypothetical protein